MLEDNQRKQQLFCESPDQQLKRRLLMPDTVAAAAFLVVMIVYGSWGSIITPSDIIAFKLCTYVYIHILICNIYGFR